jgi:hypothetical protein
MLLSNYNVCTRAFAVFVLLVLVLFAFASCCFLCCSFAFIIVIFCAYYNLNFLVCFLLYIEDYIKVDVVIGT